MSDLQKLMQIMQGYEMGNALVTSNVGDVIFSVV